MTFLISERELVFIEKAQGYDFFKDEDGAWIAVEKATGRIYSAYETVRPVGTTEQTPEQQRLNREKKAAQEKAWKRGCCSGELGRFFFVGCKERFDLPPNDIVRLIYLHTYVERDGRRIMLTRDKQMKKADLEKVLFLSRQGAFYFWNRVSPKYIAEDDSGGLISKDVSAFVKGKIRHSAKGDAFLKFYVKGVRKLFESVAKQEPYKLKYVGYLFDLLPFVNIQYNVLCSNPDEEELDDVQSITLKQFCEYIGYDFNHVDRLITAYKQILIEVHGRKERFCSCTGLDKSEFKIFVNPHILYSGTDYERVEVLGEFCKPPKSRKEHNHA